LRIDGDRDGDGKILIAFRELLKNTYSFDVICLLKSSSYLGMKKISVA